MSSERAGPGVPGYDCCLWDCSCWRIGSSAIMRSMPLPGPNAKCLLRACGWASVLLVSCVGCQAQQDPPPVFTLKVYTNLVQVPTLVLGHDRQPLAPLNFDRFQVSLDAGKKFAPTRVRMEGD